MPKSIDDCVIDLVPETAAKYGQRAFVGKVCMDRDSPAHYVESTSDSLKETAHFCEELMAMNDPLITPIITPRCPEADTPYFKHIYLCSFISRHYYLLIYLLLYYLLFIIYLLFHDE